MVNALPGQVNADSLKAIFHDKGKVDSVRLAALLSVSGSFLKSNPDSAIYYAQLLRDEALKVGSKKFISRALLAEGYALMQKGNLDLALELYERSLKISEEIQDKKGHANALNNLGIVHNRLGNYNQAINYYKRSLHFWEETGDQKMKAGTLINMGNIHHNRSQYVEALDYFRQGERICNEIGEKGFLGNALVNMGMVYASLGDFQKAIFVLEGGLKIQRELGNKRHTANALIHIGDVYWDMAEYSSALEYYKSALEIYEAIGSKDEQSIALVNVSGEYARQKRFDEALDYAFRAKDLAEQTGTKAGMSIAFDAIGKIFKDKGDYQQAKEYYQRSLELNQELGRKGGVADALQNLCDIAISQGDYQRGMDFGKQALQISRETGNIKTMSTIAESLYKACKSAHVYDKALSYFELFVEMRDSLQRTENQKAIIRYQVNADYEKQKAVDDLEHEKRLAIEEQKKRSQQRLSIAVGTGMLLAAVLALVTLNRLRVTRRQKTIIEDQKKRVEQSEKYKEQFLANMSHEIRTPMHAISGMVKILERNTHPPSQDAYLKAMRTNADNLVVILNDILDLSKIEAGKLDIESIPMNPAAAVENVAQILQYKAEEKGLALTYQIEAGVPSLVMGDPTRLNQILINLVGNAVKFTEKGNIDIHLGRDNDWLKFSVKDTGVGIPKEKQEHIFEAFEQAKDSTSRQYGGTGLGLNIARQLVELQQGKLWVESEEGKGSTFYVELPLVLAAASVDGKEIITGDRLREMAASLKGIKILLAEDNPFNQMIAKDDLSYYIEAVQIDTAENGAVALDKFRTGHYDLVLMDVQMPEMNGFEATKRIREIERSEGREPGIPVIAMTASLLKKEIDQCYAAGMNDYIPKPYKAEELIGSIFREWRA